MIDITKLTKSDAIIFQSGLKALGYYHGTTRGLPARKTIAAYEKYNRSFEKNNSFADELVAIAKKEVGTEEIGNNSGAKIREYQAATWYAPAPWPWCAAFVCWCFRETLKKYPLAIARPTTPGAWDFENWARKEGVELIKPASKTKIKKGDILVYTFSHIGIAVADEKGGRVATVEGNTNSAGSREGDGVYKKSRKKSKVRSIIRI